MQINFTIILLSFERETHIQRKGIKNGIVLTIKRTDLFNIYILNIYQMFLF